MQATVGDRKVEVGADRIGRLAIDGAKERDRDHHPRDGGEPRRPPSQGSRTASPPFPPALDRAAVGDSDQRQVAQVAAQVVGQVLGRVVAVGRVRCQAPRDDIQQADGHSRPFRIESIAARPGLGTRPGECLEHQASEGVEIGAAVDGCGNRFASLRGLEARLLFGRHPARRTADRAHKPLASADRTARQVEVEEHRLAVAGEQDV